MAKINFCTKCKQFVNSKASVCPTCNTSINLEQTQVDKIREGNIWSFREKNIIKGNKIVNFRNFTLELFSEEISINFNKVIHFKDLSEEECLKELNESAKINIKKSDNTKITMVYDEIEKEPFVELEINGIKKPNPYSKVKKILSNFSIADIINDNYYVDSGSIDYVGDHATYGKLVNIMKNSYLEILIKSGFGYRTFIKSYENKNGKNPVEILGITKAQITFLKKLMDKDKEYIEKYGFWDYSDYYALFRKEKIDLTKFKKAVELFKKNFEKNKTLYKVAAKIVNTSIDGVGMSSFLKLFQISSKYNIDIAKLTNYITDELVNKQGIFDIDFSISKYQEMLKRLEKIEEINSFEKFPKDFLHQCNKILLKYCLFLENELNEKFQKAVAGFDNYLLEDDKYLVTYPKSIQDLIIEGERLKDCLSSYVNDCINKESLIFFMREKSNPEKAFIAFELDSKRRIVQIRGYANRNATSEESEFVSKFVKNMKNIESNKKKEKEKITA